MKAAFQAIPEVSAEVFTIPLDGKYIIYAPLRRAAFVGNAAVVNFLANLMQGRYDKSADVDGSFVEFLRRIEILDAGPKERVNTKFSGDPLPTTVTLFLTTACNLRCAYCYAAAGAAPVRRMSLETAKRAIEFVAANAIKKNEPSFEIGYHGGGEPTLNWKVMAGSFEFAQRKAAKFGLSMKAESATNGVLRDDQIEWITSNLSGVSVSFDGLPEVNDRHRVTVRGTGSSERIMYALRRFDEATFPYGIRVTVTHDQITNLPHSIEFICANFRPICIQVEPAYQLGRWANAPSAETQQFIDAYRESQQRATQYGFEICYSAARLNTLTNHFCGVTRDTFAVSPDGNVSACYEVFSEDHPLADTFFYAKPNEEAGGYTFNLRVLEHLRRQTVERREFCRGCFAKWHCAGDCYHKSLTVNHRGKFVGSERCHITRELTKDQLLTRIAASGGLFWHEPPGAFSGEPVEHKEILS